MADVYRIVLGMCNVYLVRENDHCILIDAGNAHKEKQFARKLKKYHFTPEQIELIVITHVHYDHVGSIKAIKNLCDCPVAVHENEAHLLKNGDVVLPRGTNLLGKIVMGLGRTLLTLYPKPFRFSPTEADIIIRDELSLEEYGFPGRIISTPGHTAGSVSVVLSGGQAFVGDLAINYLPFGRGPIFPPFANDVDLLLKSWDYLLEQGAETIFPGHGKPFHAGRLREKFNELSS